MTTPALFPPPQQAASLYFGKVMHMRLAPVSHRFAYKVFNLLIDVGRLGEAGQASPLFSVGRFNLLSFYPRDHADPARGSLFAQIKLMLEPAGVIPDQVLLLCYPRVLGFVFNPLSVYYCYRGGALVGLVYEVRNTFGERHSYIAPLEDGEASISGIRQERAKRFFVSPFMEMDLNYRFRLRPPGADIAVRILEMAGEKPIFAATFHGMRSELSTKAIIFAFFGLPLMTLKVVAGIYWEALRLWLKGMRLKSRPPAPDATSLVVAGKDIGKLFKGIIK